METGTASEPPADLSRQLAEAFMAFGPNYMKWVSSQLPADKLSFGRMRLLSALQCHGPRIMSDLSEELHVTPRNVTQLVDALEEQGWVRRRPKPKDRRATVIELTDQGAQQCAGMFDEHLNTVAKLFTGLSAEDQRELLRLITRLTAALEHRDSPEQVGPRAG